MITVTAIGECMIEMVRGDSGEYTCHYGGDTFNMSQYLSWLAQASQDDTEDTFTVRYLTALGADSLSKNMLESWRANGINTDLVIQHPTRNAGLYFAHTDEKGDRDYIFYRSQSAAKEMFSCPDSEAVFEKALDTQLLYTSAISLMILDSQGRERLIALFAEAQKRGIMTAFDTNYRAAGWVSTDEAAEWMNKIFPYIDVILPTDDENKIIFGDADRDATADRMMEFSPKEVVVKSGPDGCLLSLSDKREMVAPEKALTPLDTTSAGDSFNAAYLYSRLRGKDPVVSAQNGHKLAGKVIQYRGALIPRDVVEGVRASFAA